MKSPQTLDSERLDLPSASSARRRRRCPGSQNLIDELRAQGLLKVIPESQDAKKGTRIHTAWAGEKDEPSPDELRPDELVTLEELRRLEALVLADWSGQEEYTLLGREERLWLHQGIEPIFSVRYDCAYVAGTEHDRLLLLDAKTGYSDVDPAEHNDQLRETVALFRVHCPWVKTFRVAILAPKSNPSISIADYDQTEAEFALRQLKYSLADARQPDSPRIPGPYCSYCPANLQCPEARQLVPHIIESLGSRVEAGNFDLPLGQAGANLLGQLKTVKAIVRSLEEGYKRELAANPDSLPGWRLRDGKKVRSLPDARGAFDAWMRFDKYALSAADFLESTDVSISRLEQRLGTMTGFKGRRLASFLGEIFDGLITTKQYAPELEQFSHKTIPS